MGSRLVNQFAIRDEHPAGGTPCQGGVMSDDQDGLALRRQLFGRSVVFHLRAMEASFAERLRALPAVQSVQVVDRKLVVGLEDPESANPQLIRTLVEAGASLPGDLLLSFTCIQSIPEMKDEITCRVFGSEGVIVTDGGRFGGYGLFLSKGEAGRCAPPWPASATPTLFSASSRHFARLKYPVEAIRSLRADELHVAALQDYHARV